MIVNVLLDTQGFKAKPVDKVGIIQNRIFKYPTQISIPDLADKIANKGYSFKPAILTGSKKSDWTQQQVFVLDFDNDEGLETTIQDQIDYAISLNILPVFMYPSFSHSESKHKFRMVFVMDKNITDLELRNKVEMTFHNLFNKSDPVTFNTDRLFFGGTSISYSNYESRINIDTFLNTYFKEEYLDIINATYGKSNKVKKNDKIIINNKIKESNIPIVKVNIVKDKIITNIDLIKNHNIKELKYKLFGEVLPKNNPITYCHQSFEVGLEESESIYNNTNSIISLHLNPIVPQMPIQQWIEGDNLKVYNKNSMFDLICNIDMNKFLGINSNMFPCIFHDDNNPSANIIKNDKNGHYLYKCFSSQCKGFVGNIITMVERISKCTKFKAIEFIKEVYNIELAETEWQKLQKQTLQTNKDCLYNAHKNGYMKDEYPELYKKICNYIPILITLHDIALHYVYDESLSDDDPNNVIFFSALSYICQVFDTTFSKSLNEAHASTRINLMTFFKLINKLKNDQIPTSMLKMAQHKSMKNEHKNIITFYNIPEYNHETLSNAEELAKQFKNLNMTMRGMSREMLIRTVGKEEADRVFPQYEVFELAEKHIISGDIIENICLKLLKDKQYILEKDVFKRMPHTTEGIKYTKDMKKTKFKKILPELLLKYNLRKVRMNKDLKQYFNIGGQGYTDIILKEDFELPNT